MTTKELLDRDKIDSFVQAKLAAPISLLREQVDCGVSLIDKCARQGGSISDLIIIGHFFKHSVRMLDAVEIQLSRGAVLAANVSARSMLEVKSVGTGEWQLPRTTGRPWECDPWGHCERMFQSCVNKGRVNCVRACERKLGAVVRALITCLRPESTCRQSLLREGA